MQMKILLSLTMLLCVSLMNAQFGVGQWRDHLPYGQCIDIADGGDVVYVATANAAFAFDPEDNSITRISKVNKLSDSGLSSLAYNLETKTLVVGYVNGNLDLVIEGRPYNIPDIKRSDVLADKTIHDIYFKDHFAYLSCGFGIVQIDTEKLEVSDSYFMGPSGNPIQVYNLKDDGEDWWACTEDGVYSAPINHPFLANFQSWFKRDDVPMPDEKFSDIEINDQYYLLKADTSDVNVVYFKSRVDGSDWEVFPTFEGEWIRDVFMDDQAIMLSSWGVLKIYNMELQLDAVWGNIDGITTKGNGLLRDSTGAIWVANDENGLIGYNQVGKVFNALPDGPRKIGLRRIDAFNDELWVASGGVDGAWVSQWNAHGAYGFTDESWSTVLSFNGQNINDLMDVTINPLDNTEVFLGSWLKGLVHIKDGEIINLYNETNSSMTVASFGGNDRVAIGGVDFDPQGNLWISNNQTETPLHVRTLSGEFQAYSFVPEMGTDVLSTEVLATQQGYIWLVLPGGDGLLVVDHKGTLLDTSDDEYKVLENVEGKGGLPVEWINCVEEDLDGEIWVGTLQGPAIFYSPEAIFNSDEFDAQQILIEQDGNIQILLETENITCIEIDGANRKWIGTQHSGTFLMSEDGVEQIQHFTANNSPLLSDNILDIAINHESGEVFFATERGIVSYRSDATNFYEEMEEVNIFPNPIRPDYEGVITIDGLSRNADIKISDISGNVVYQTEANGGRATWNGLNFDGQRVSTGVYLVFATTPDGQSTNVSKIAFVN